MFSLPSRTPLAGILAAFLLLVPHTGVAQNVFHDAACQEGASSALSGLPAPDDAITSLIHGTYVVDETQGSSEGGLPDNDAFKDFIVFHDDQGVIRGGSLVDPGGYFFVSISSLEGEQGLPIYPVLCDYQRDKIVRVDLYKDGNPDTPVRINQQVTGASDLSATRTLLFGNAYPNSVEDWDDVALEPGPGKDALDTMTIIGFVTVHGLDSKDESGTLGTFWSGIRESDGAYGSWMTGKAEPFEDPHHDDRMLYKITVSGYEWGDEITFVQNARDPRTLEEGHFGVGRDTFIFIPGGQLGSERFPLEIVLLHPPFLKPDLPGQVIRAGESFEPIDLTDLIVDPTGQEIDFRIAKAEGVSARIDSLNMLHLSYPSDWTGADRIQLQATHSTGELTLRHATFAVIGGDLRYPFWSPPLPGTFTYSMRVIAAFNEEAGVTLDHLPTIGAFDNGLLRGASTAVSHNGQARMILDVHSNDPGALIDFIGYTVANNEFIQAPIQIPFEPDATIGSLDDPVRIGYVVTDTESGMESIPEQVTIQATYPNPAHGVVNLHWNLSESSPVRISISDGLGRTTELLHRSYAPAGPGQESLRLDGFATGMYWIAIESETGRATKALVVIGQ
jgi:hypothetical protein